MLLPPQLFFVALTLHRFFLHSVARLKESDFPSLKRYFKALCVGAQGVLLENEVLKIEIKHEYKGSSGRMAACYTNKTASDFVQFASSIPDVPFLKFQHQLPSDLIPAGGQVQHRILMECVQPFESAPGVSVFSSFLMKCGHSYFVPDKWLFF
jgi:hypothetical protein